MSLNNLNRLIALSFLILPVFVLPNTFAQNNDLLHKLSTETAPPAVETANINLLTAKTAEAGDSKAETIFSAIPNRKSNINLERHRDLLPESWTSKADSAFEADAFAKHNLQSFPAVNFNFKSLSPNQKEIRSEPNAEPTEPTEQNTNLFEVDKNNRSNSAKQPDEGFRWFSAVKQTLMFLGVQHGYAFTQPKTREAIKGKFWKDYVKSVKSLHGWDDGGRFFTNYIAHPMEGAFLGFIQIQNDPQGLKQEFGASSGYWRSRLKAMAWSAAWSTQFEIGPISQASIGNVGLKGKQTYVDIVITPTVGTALLIGEDAIDRFITKRIERSTNSFYVRAFSRMLLSPTRTIANLFRFKTPWYRDRPIAQ